MLRLAGGCRGVEDQVMLTGVATSGRRLSSAVAVAVGYVLTVAMSAAPRAFSRL